MARNRITLLFCLFLAIAGTTLFTGCKHEPPVSPASSTDDDGGDGDDDDDEVHDPDAELFE